jgi:hypothetical protein
MTSYASFLPLLLFSNPLYWFSRSPLVLLPHMFLPRHASGGSYGVLDFNVQNKSFILVLSTGKRWANGNGPIVIESGTNGSAMSSRCRNRYPRMKGSDFHFFPVLQMLL